MKKKNGHLTVVVGLPGSGKTTLLSKLRKKATGLFADDFMKNISPDSPVKRDPTFTDSRHYRTLITDLRKGRSCVISDIIFCDTLLRAVLALAVNIDVKNLKLDWKFFENDPEQCIINARYRNRPKTLARELKLIRFLSQKYFLPEGVTPLKIWKAQKIKR